MQSNQKSTSSSCITTLVCLIYLYSLAFSQVSSLDTLKPGDVLSSTSRLTSARKTFTLGFYNEMYVAIWYTVDLSSPVWIGNRDNPVYGNPRLTISSNGSLLIAPQGNGEADPFELYSGAEESSRNVSATLLDTGNFVVMSSNASGVYIILWQSFDHPTDTLLPGMKLGVNHRTGRNSTMVSWLGPSNPASGAFSMEWNGRRLIVRRRGVVYWTSGEMKDYYFKNLRLKEFENVNTNPDDLSPIYNFTSYSSENEEYFMYSLAIYPMLLTYSRLIISMWRLDSQGDLYDKDRQVIERVGLCSGYKTQGNEDFVNGCELREQPKCRNERQMFVRRSGVFIRSREVYDENSSLSLSDCRVNCWNDCECAGYTYNYVYDGKLNCLYFRGKNLTFQDSRDGSRPVLYVLESPSSVLDSPSSILGSPSSDKTTGGKRLIRIILPVAMSIVLLLSVAALFLKQRIKRRKREQKVQELLTLEGYTEAYEHESGGGKGHDLRLFTYASITAATNNFSPDYKLGEGGFGPVYKGKTTDGQLIAVKLLSRKSGQGLVEFKTELILISKLQHVNLVKLVGFCIHGDHKMIVYDYLPNKSLDFHLFDPSRRDQLDWGHRLKIIEGIAQGILYLHKYSRLRIVHRDLKCGNILLDQNLNPKISDFGLARIFNQNMNEANTNRRVGTYGYMAPEYAMQGKFSYKSDVYSFGVLVLEIVSGRKNSSFQDIEGPLDLVEYAWELWNKDSATQLMDPTLRSSCIVDQVQRCINIGLLCVENRAVDRPDMEDVILMLGNETTSLPLPKNPAFITRNAVVEEQQRSKPEELSIANELTISEIGGR